MKLVFTPPQLSYIDSRMSTLVVASKHESVDEETRRTVRKMRTKFAPGASTYVWLSKKERSLLFSMLEYRLRALIDAKSASDEADVVSDLMDTLTNDGGDDGRN